MTAKEAHDGIMEAIARIRAILDPQLKEDMPEFIKDIFGGKA